MKARHKDTGEIIELAEEGIISCDGRRFCWYQVELIPEPIDDFKPSLPSNLDETMEEEAQRAYDEPTAQGFAKRSFFKRGFKAGVEWMAGQGVSWEDIMTYYDGFLLYGKDERAFTMEEDFNEGDKVIVQIRKK